MKAYGSKKKNGFGTFEVKKGAEPAKAKAEIRKAVKQLKNEQ